MSKHSNIRNLLYDYATATLSDDGRRSVEQHLSSCKQCADDLKEIQQAIALLPQPAKAPSDARDEMFWSHLAMNVEREIRQKQAKPNWFVEIVEGIRSFFTLRPTYAYTIGGSLAILLLAVVVFRWQPTESDHIAEVQIVPNDSTMMLADLQKSQARVSHYFRKSRTLLVGLANMRTDDAAHFDLSAEKSKARALIREAGFVRMQPINNRTERLVNDLERILIELANLEETNDIPNVEMIRSGIHQENLLFKIRMAEAAFDTSRRAARERIY